MNFKKILIINKKHLNKRPLHEWFENSSESVILITTTDSLIGMPNIIKEKFLKIEIIDDYNSWLVEEFVYSLCELYDINLIVSSSEDDVIRVARMRNHMGLSGQSIESAIAYRNKLVMKKICSSEGISIPKYSEVNSPIDLLSFINKQGFPVVIKPCLGAGSVGVKILRNMNDFENFVVSGAISVVPDSYGIWLVEEFIEAEFYHVDGLMQNGEILHCWPSHYSSGNFESLKNSEPIYSILIDAEDSIYKQLCTFAKKIISKFPPTPFITSFHLETWLTDNGPMFCEVASRTGGGTVSQSYYKAFGINLSKISMRGQAERSLNIISQPIRPQKYVGSVVIPPKDESFIPPLSNCPISNAVVTYNLEAITENSGESYAGKSVATVIVDSVAWNNVYKKVQKVLNWWKGEL